MYGASDGIRQCLMWQIANGRRVKNLYRIISYIGYDAMFRSSAIPEPP
jgi:hypothetical protein